MKALEKKLLLEYSKAFKELKATAKQYFKIFDKADKRMWQKMNAGYITQQEYTNWRTSAVMYGKRYDALIKGMAKAITAVNQGTARSITDMMPEVYIENYNFIQEDAFDRLNMSFNFQFVNQDTLKNLLDENHTILPNPSKNFNIPKDLKWNESRVRSAITQGIIQGDSMLKIADRLKSVENMTDAQAMRTARTAVTGAENAGRMDSMRYMEKIGLQPKKQWVATLDHRTRDSHVDVDGEIRELDEEFSNGLDYPGGMGDPSEVYNCRCTMITVFED